MFNRYVFLNTSHTELSVCIPNKAKPTSNGISLRVELIIGFCHGCSFKLTFTWTCNLSLKEGGRKKDNDFPSLTPCWNSGLIEHPEPQLQGMGHLYIFCSSIPKGALSTLRPQGCARDWWVPPQVDCWQQFHQELKAAWALHLKVTKGQVKIFEWVLPFWFPQIPIPLGSRVSAACMRVDIHPKAYQIPPKRAMQHLNTKQKMECPEECPRAVVTLEITIIATIASIQKRQMRSTGKCYRFKMWRK